MYGLISHILLAIALIFFIEGLIYAIFPKHIQKIMKMASELESEKFRYYGASMVVIGIMSVWLLQKILY